MDPIANEYPELSSYQFASNSPIRFIDIDGREAFGFRLDVYSEALANSNGQPQFTDYVKAAVTVTGNNMDNVADALYNGGKSTVMYLPNLMGGTMKDVTKYQQDEAQHIMHRGREYEEIKENGGDYNDVEKLHQVKKSSNEIKISKDYEELFGLSLSGAEASIYDIIDLTIEKRR